MKLEVTRNWAAGTIAVRAAGYARFMLDKFGFSGCAPVQCPAYDGEVPNADMESRVVDETKYRAKVGSLWRKRCGQILRRR